MRIDVNAFLGAYPYARVPGTAPDRLVQALDRIGIDEAWVSHLPSLVWRQPMEGNAWLYDTAAREQRLRPVPAVHPGLAGWEAALGEAKQRCAAAVRCDPPHYAIDPAGPEVRGLAAAGGPARHADRDDRRGALRVRNGSAIAPSGERRRQARSAGGFRRAACRD